MKKNITIAIAAITFGFMAAGVGPGFIQSTKYSNVNNIKNMYVLGDSLADTGAFALHNGMRIPNRDWTHVIPANFRKPHYNFSFSNGKLANKLVAERFGIRLKPAAYHWDRWDAFRILKEAKNVVGNNYAAAGAQILPTQGNIMQLARGALVTDNFRLEKQVEALKIQHKTIKSNELVSLVFGTNDVIAAVDKHESFPEAVMKAEIKILDQAVGRLIKEITELKFMGARRIIIANVPHFGNAPKYGGYKFNHLQDRHVDNVTSRRQAASFKFVDHFNKMLKFWIDGWNQRNNNIARIFDLGTHFNSILLNKYIKENKNFRNNATKMFAPHQLLSRWYKPELLNGATLQNLDNYAFFDELHVTGGFHQYIADELYKVVNRPW